MTHTWPPDHTFWTGTFPDHTTARTTPYLFKGLIPATAANPDDVLDGLAALRRAHAADIETKAKARIYVGENRRDDLLPDVLRAPAWEDGGFVTWMQSLAQADRFSLVINNLETLSPRLAVGLGAFLNSLIHGWGLPLGGAEQVAFAGNYAGTAFGIHEGYEDAFLIHLGPNAKNFYTWPADQYEKLTGGNEPTYGDYHNLLQQGEHFLLEPGDALFLPRRVFHVGTQDQFSVSVALPLYTYPHARIVEDRILPDILSAVGRQRPDDPLNAPSPMAPPAAGSGPIADQLADAGRKLLQAATERVSEAARQHALQRWDTLLSNGGWELTEQDLARQEAAAAFDPRQVTPGATLSLIAPYRLITTDGHLMLRGFGIPYDNAALPQETIAALNAGEHITLPEDSNVLAAVRALGGTGGLRLSPRSANSEATTS